MKLLRARSALSRSKGAASTFACASLSSVKRARAFLGVSSRSLIQVFLQQRNWRHAVSANLVCTDSSHRHHLIDGALPAFAFAHFVGNVTRCIGICGNRKV